MPDNERQQVIIKLLERYFKLPEEQRYEFKEMIELYDDLTQVHSIGILSVLFH